MLSPRSSCRRPIGTCDSWLTTVCFCDTCALAPALLPMPTTRQREAGLAAAPGLGLQLSVRGLLSRRSQPSTPQPQPLNQGGGPTGPTASYEAAVSWRLYDADDQFLTSGVALVPVTADSPTQWTHFSTTIPVSAPLNARPGHLEVQLLNGGSQPVYFDSVSIRHPQVELVVSQENHYYPFGMNLKGLAVNTLPAEATSKNQFNDGSELQDENLDDESGVYSTPYRSYDLTIGRFQGVDPLADSYADTSPYQFAGNDPLNRNDPTGAFEVNAFGDMFLKPGRGSGSDGFYNTAAYDPGGYGLGLGVGSSPGPTPWATTGNLARQAESWNRQASRTNLVVVGIKQPSRLNKPVALPL